MSHMKKWITLVESMSPVVSTPPAANSFDRDCTVILGSSVGGGVGRFVKFTTDGSALIDVKGVIREFANGEFTIPQRDLENGNEWSHINFTHNTPGTDKNNTAFRPGDMVKIADVYGTVIGPGFGTFIGYGTTGEDCIVLFDGKQLVVPTENLASVLEQDAKNNFDQMDNDGNLSPMSFGSDNVKIEQPANSGMQSTEHPMDQRDEFKKWINVVNGDFGNDEIEVDDTAGDCGCMSWSCPQCFPDDGNTGMPNRPAEQEVEFKMGLEEEPADEQENKFSTKSSRGGVKLGDIVQKTEYREVGQDSPLSSTEVNERADIDSFDSDSNMDIEPTYNFQDDPDQAEVDQYNDMMFGGPQSEEDVDSALDMIENILDMQRMGVSKADKNYDETELSNMSMPELTRIHSQATGNQTPVTETVDKDVAAMLSSLKKYDKLVESVAPVLGMKTVKMANVVESNDDDHEPNDEMLSGARKQHRQDEKDYKDSLKDAARIRHFMQQEIDAENARNALNAKKSVKESSEVDPEVLEWMNRFAKLGNMKGYGR